MSNRLQSSFNPAFNPYAVDDGIEIVRNRSNVNHAYEDAETSTPHHYEDPSFVRRNVNPCYGSADGHVSPSSTEQTAIKLDKDSQVVRVILFVILVVSIVSVALVVLVIAGKLGASCTCSENTGSPSISDRQQAVGQITLDKVYQEIDGMKKNFSEIQVDLTKKILDLEKELVHAKNQIEVLQKNDKDTIQIWKQINETKNQINNVSKMDGPRGPRGYNGSQGIQGIKGDKGDKGDTGAAGSKGDKGDTGSQGPKGDTGPQGLQGPKGDKGDTGAAGSKGDKGDTGSQGPKGDKGDTGSQGTKGDKGDTGATGPIGVQGPPGAGNLTQCDVKIHSSGGTNIGTLARQTVKVIQETGKKILHFSCSSNNADIVESRERFDSGKMEYSCFCLGQGSFDYSKDAQVTEPSLMKCYITYTECQLT